MKVKELNSLPQDRWKKYQQWEWSREVLDACPNYVYCVSSAMTSHSNRYHFPEMTVVMAHFDKSQMTFCHPEHELKDIIKKVIKKSSFNLKYVKHIYKEWTEAKSDLLKIYQDAEENKLRSLTKKQLLKFYEELIERSIETLGLAIFIDGFTVGKEKIAEDNFLHFLNTRGEENKFGKYYEILTKIEKPSFLTRFEQDIASAVAGKDKINTNSTKKIISEYSWIRSSYSDYLPIDQEYIEEQISYLGDKKEEVGDVSAQKSKLLSQLDPPPEIVNQLELMTLLSGWQDERKEICLRSVEKASMFLDEFARRLDLPKEYLKWVTPYEIRDLFTVKPSLNNFKKRMRECLMIQREGNTQIIAGSESTKIKNSLYPTRKQKAIRKITGLAASPGKAGGRVKILLSAREESKLKPGDILVAGMTRPDYMPAIRKAGAIITDEGGVTCHAAIVSREMKIPCIVGTRTATEVLRDGDQVEVDGEEGVVRIIK